MRQRQRPAHVLLVDDDDTFREVMSAELTRRGHVVNGAARGAEAIERALAFEPDVILLDLRLPDMEGLDVLKALRERNVPAAVIMLTGHGTIDTAIQAIRLGAQDYLEKPCPIEKLEVTVRKSCEHLRLVKRQKVLEDGYAAPSVGVGLVGQSPAFRQMLETVSRVARADSTTLILGETGVGKEMVATLLHAQSARAEAPFVVVDCTSLHEELLHSELFGHEQGSFTGATRQKHGLFEVAHGGTLFLDEVGDTSPEIQAKLLRVLETGRFRRLGGTEEIQVDVRVVSATNRNLGEAIRRGHFREDLYYRLATLTVRIPPLRERPEDIRELVQHFTERFNRRFSVTRSFTPEAMAALVAHNWPGNVRELIHVVEQAVVLAREDAIGPEELAFTTRIRGGVAAAAGATGPGGEVLPLREVERRHVLAVVNGVGGNRAQAARLLQVSERNLYRLLDRYGWKPPARDQAGDSAKPEPAGP